MANGKPNTARRRELRRNSPRSTSEWAQVARRKDVLWAVFYALLFTGIGGGLALQYTTDRDYQVGQYMERPVVTRVGFSAVDEERTKERKREAAEDEPAVYVANRQYLESLIDRFTGLIGLADYTTLAEVPPESVEQLQLDQQALDQLKKYYNTEGQPIEQWEIDARRFLQGLFELAILDPAEYKHVGIDPIVIMHPDPHNGGEERLFRYPNRVYSTDETDDLKELIEREALKFPRPLQRSVLSLVMSDLNPTYLFDAELTRQQRDRVYQDTPPAVLTYDANRVLIPAGDTLTPFQVELLKQERLTYDVRLGHVHAWLVRAGVFGSILLIMVGLWVYIFTYNHKVARNPMRGFALTMLLMGCLAGAVFATQAWPSFMLFTVTFPTLLAAIILAIVYDQRFALAVGAIQSLVVMASMNLSIGIELVVLAGLGIAVSQLKEVRSSSKLVLVGLWTGLAMGVTTLVVGVGSRPLDLPGELVRIGWDAIGAVASGLLVGIIVQGVLPFIERLFRVTTAMRLKELNDASHPLLQRLAQEAPGTYQHSLRIADMAEAAADAINGNGLLCRVGAMYHDIGKINKPMYFIENQGGGPNRHNKLSPAMSLLIIVGHVKDGMEMAREYGLPTVLKHFIESHHGTTLVEYFYHAAKRKTEAEDKPGPSEFEFRYPGPKPQTKEAAIMLLCDGMEAAARTLPDPTPVRLEQLVHNIAIKRLMDGQLDESAMTLAELHRVEQAITKTLCAIYHARIQYPAEKPEPGAVQPQTA